MVAQNSAFIIKKIGQNWIITLNEMLTDHGQLNLRGSLVLTIKNGFYTFITCAMHSEIKLACFTYLFNSTAFQMDRLKSTGYSKTKLCRCSYHLISSLLKRLAVLPRGISLVASLIPQLQPKWHRLHDKHSKCERIHSSAQLNLMEIPQMCSHYLKCLSPDNGWLHKASGCKSYWELLKVKEKQRSMIKLRCDCRFEEGSSR